MADCCKEYCDTCGEYLAIVKDPLGFYGAGSGCAGYKALLSCNQSDPLKAFTALGAFGFQLAVISAVIDLIFQIIWMIVYPGYVADFVGFILGLIMGWFMAHLWWFILVKKNACCGKPCYAVLATICVVFGFLGIVFGVLGIIAAPIFIIPTLFYILKAYVLFMEGKWIYAHGDICCQPGGSSKVQVSPAAPPSPVAPVAAPVIAMAQLAPVKAEPDLEAAAPKQEGKPEDQSTA